MKLCQHCNQNPVSRPRRLCWACYYAPGVRDRYSVHSIHARRGSGAGPMHGKPTVAPTDAKPGTLEKVLVLEAMALDGQELWHPGDFSIAGELSSQE